MYFGRLHTKPHTGNTRRNSRLNIGVSQIQKEPKQRKPVISFNGSFQNFLNMTNNHQTPSPISTCPRSAAIVKLKVPKNMLPDLMVKIFLSYLFSCWSSPQFCSTQKLSFYVAFSMDWPLHKSNSTALPKEGRASIYNAFCSLVESMVFKNEFTRVVSPFV